MPRARRTARSAWALPFSAASLACPVPPLIHVSQDCDGAGTAICHLATGPLEESRLFEN